MTHLAPRYCPHWTDDEDTAFIHLEGEFDFRADLPGSEVRESLAERAEMIGALVSLVKKSSEGPFYFDAYPWNGPGYFRCVYRDGEPIHKIIVFGGDGDVADTYEIEEMAAEYEDRPEWVKELLNNE